jgi:phosphohistidine phosphatase
MRHGEASMRAATDALRPLTERGEIETSYVAQAAIKAGMKPSKVFVSPYLRAQQSFKQVLQWLPKNLDVKTLDLITPDNDPSVVLEYLMLNCSDEEDMLLVCHQPLAGRLISLICDGNDYGMGLNTSTIAALECTITAASCGDLLWLKEPSNS